MCDSKSASDDTNIFEYESYFQHAEISGNNF